MNAKQREELLGTLKARFETNMKRHGSVEWAPVQARLEKANDSRHSQGWKAAAVNRM
jgi:hypothetical protein